MSNTGIPANTYRWHNTTDGKLLAGCKRYWLYVPIVTEGYIEGLLDNKSKR